MDTDPNAPSSLSFEEFTAVSERHRNKKKVVEAKEKQEKQKTQKIATKDDNKDDNNKDDNSASVGFGDILEMWQTQSFIIVMIVLDTFASFAEIVIAYKLTTKLIDEGTSIEGETIVTKIDKYLTSPVTMTILKGLSSFAFTISCIECLGILLVFRVDVITHFGYITDFAVLSLQMYLELNGMGKETRLLNILRIWRMLRLMYAWVTIEKDNHDLTKESLVQAEDTFKQAQMTAAKFEGELEQEKEARKAIEEMLQSYKEEVDTLNEALKIAAMDIAEVGQADDDDDYFLSDDEEGNEIDDITEETRQKGDLYMDAASSEYDKQKNKEVLYREAKAARDPKTKGDNVVFQVDENGSFKRK